jgi:hypothetical protein
VRLLRRGDNGVRFGNLLCANWLGLGVAPL